MTMRKRLQGESGVAMVVVMGALLVISLMAGTLAANATQTSDSAVKDSNSKRALAAAEAGLNVATERFVPHRTTLAANACLVMVSNVLTPTAMPAGTAECPPVADVNELDAGADYEYVMSMAGAACRFAPGGTSTTTAADRCITSTGIVNGVRRRVQARLSTRTGAPFFDMAGLVGLDSITMTNSNDVNTSVGSNGVISVGNSVRVNGDAVYGPGGSVQIGTGGRVNGSQIPRSEPFTLELDEDFAAARLNNDNLSLPSSWFAGGDRTLRPMFQPPNGTDATMPVPAGTDPVVYYFCNVYLDNSIKLRLPANREVKIYVDSPTRTGSPCATGGRVHLRNSIDWNWPSGPGLASNLEFYLAGTGGEDLYLENSIRASAVFYAPNSFVDVNNSVEVNGAIAAKSILINNSIKFTWPADVRDDPGPGRRVSWSGWYECRPNPSVASDPESGC